MNCCGLFPNIETASECRKCFSFWPEKAKKIYTRAQCKRKNWIGKVDESIFNDKILIVKFPEALLEDTELEFEFKKTAKEPILSN